MPVADLPLSPCCSPCGHPSAVASTQDAHPEMTPEAIRHLVDEVYADQTGVIRDFVPITVERLARERLRRALGH